MLVMLCAQFKVFVKGGGGIGTLHVGGCNDVSGLRLINHMPFGCARSPVNLISDELRTNTLCWLKITEKP